MKENRKVLVLEQLKKVPIIRVACERAGVGHATYYRWCAEDEEFERLAEEAMIEGERFISDMGESQMMTLMKDKHWSAIKYWLEHHHPNYLNRKSGGDDKKIRIIMLHDNED